jgi:hypothetical protein
MSRRCAASRSGPHLLGNTNIGFGPTAFIASGRARWVEGFTPFAFLRSRTTRTSRIFRTEGGAHRLRSHFYMSSRVVWCWLVPAESSCREQDVSHMAFAAAASTRMVMRICRTALVPPVVDRYHRSWPSRGSDPGSIVKPSVHLPGLPCASAGVTGPTRNSPASSRVLTSRRRDRGASGRGSP